MQGNILLNGLLVSVLLATLSVVVEPQSSVLRPGDPLPALVGQRLDGKALDLNVAAGIDHTVLIVSFSRAGGHDAQNWEQRLLKEFPHTTIYTVIFLESVPRLFRSIVVSGIKSEMPLSMQDRTLVVYHDEKVWKQRLQVHSDDNASVILLGKDRNVDWITAGPFADGLYQDLGARMIRFAH